MIGSMTTMNTNKHRWGAGETKPKRSHFIGPQPTLTGWFNPAEGLYLKGICEVRGIRRRAGMRRKKLQNEAIWGVTGLTGTLPAGPTEAGGPWEPMGRRQNKPGRPKPNHPPRAEQESGGRIRRAAGKDKRNLDQPRLDSKGFIDMLSRSGFCPGNDLSKL